MKVNFGFDCLFVIVIVYGELLFRFAPTVFQEVFYVLVGKAPLTALRPLEPTLLQIPKQRSFFHAEYLLQVLQCVGFYHKSFDLMMSLFYTGGKNKATFDRVPYQ